MNYIVQAGDTLFKIAQTYNTSVEAILAINPQITNPNLIYPGQIILIPTSNIKCPLLRRGDRGSAVSRLQKLLMFARFNPGPIDGIFGQRTEAALIAFQESQRELERTGIADEKTWVALGAECEPRSEVTTYIVRPGDSLYIIATRFDVTIESILEINPQITNPNVLSIGQVIDIPPS
ncbi:LysM peptidoglycan-binding domain-containing protein [Desulfosporosinus hippei]|uniref:LysM domain-containing protein n=1 Tax=Desulfosporosinus hippei DSM 8344 TaxID=1121419 RepID=A0A1G7YU11_9FIRM|nr:LysM peptidoglycan-binding domain-containing protein [Desulfosporosinus hippei]SDG99679.1 LysM domain-containing protein [Desulfosporosinus hippei DSM 8344]